MQTIRFKSSGFPPVLPFNAKALYEYLGRPGNNCPQSLVVTVTSETRKKTPNLLPKAYYNLYQTPAIFKNPECCAASGHLTSGKQTTS